MCRRVRTCTCTCVHPLASPQGLLGRPRVVALWRMSSLSKLIGDKVISSRSEKETKTSCLEGVGKVVGLYFSAHWCPPCRAFTPQLVQWYHNVKKGSNGENFDIVFLSSDRDLAQFKEYFREMPWYAVPYEARDVKVL